MIAVRDVVNVTDYIEVRDHSGSMAGAKARAALKMSNMRRKLMKEKVQVRHQVTYSQIRFGPVEVKFEFQPAETMVEEFDYPTPGGTPLIDAIGKALEMASESEGCPTIDLFTDGENMPAHNGSEWTVEKLKARIEAMDDLTISMIACADSAVALAHAIGVPPKNVLKVDDSAEGIRIATERSQAGLNKHMDTRSSGGARRSNGLY